MRLTDNSEQFSTSPFTGDGCIHEAFARQVAIRPHAVALTCGQQNLTYAELDEEASILAEHLRTMGVGPETLAGVYLDRSSQMVVALLAVLKAGGGYLPIDASCPAERLLGMLDDAQPVVLISEDRLMRSLPQTRVATVCLDREWAPIAVEPRHVITSVAGSETLAYVIYTSGSTGKPKGVIVTHRNVMRLMAATDAWFHFGPSDVWTLFHSVAFDFSVWEIWACLVTGGRLVIVPFALSRSPGEFYELLSEERVTVLNQTPSAFYQLIQVEQESGCRDLSLRFVIFGGEALNFAALRPWFQRHGDRTPTLVNMYGITETTVHVTYRALTAHEAESTSASLIGEPIPDLAIHLLDADGKPVPVGVVGEIYVSGAGVARGYLNRPDLTAERFLPDPFPGNHSGRMYRSGDLARRLPDGDLEYLGRRDAQVKINGFRIELGEIEAAIVEHPAILHACVISHVDAHQAKRLVAYYVPAAQKAIRPGELGEFLSHKLPPYMVPTLFMQVDSLPLTVNGKIDRAALPSPSAGSRIPDAQEVHSQLEKQISDIWRGVLHTQNIGLDDGFFHIGGGSLLIVQVQAQLQELLGRAIPVTDLFEFTTVRQLAKRLSQNCSASNETFQAARSSAQRQRAAFAQRHSARGARS